MTEERILEMSENEVMLKTYDLVRSDMSTALFESEAETMQNVLNGDIDALRQCLIDSVDYVSDDEYISYKDVVITIDENESVLILWEDAEKWFDDVESVVKFIDSNAA